MQYLQILLLLLLCVGTLFCVSCGGIVEEDEESDSTDVTITVQVTDTETAETEETIEDTEIPVYLNPDGREFAALFGSFFHVESFTAAYGWDTGEEVVIFSVEYTANEPNPGTAMLSVNGGTPFDISCVQLSDICVTQEFIVVVPSFTDIGGPLWVFDYDGNLIFAAHDVTAEGAEFRELRAAEDDGITVIASRIRHMELTGNAALELQAPYAAYQNLLWDDPTSDCLPGNDAELPDVFSVDLSCGWDAVPDALNPELVVSGEYRIPYLGDGQFGQIVPTEHMKTLQTFMEAQFGERTPAVTQEPMTEPVTEPTDITPPDHSDLAAAVDYYLDLLMDGAGDLFLESDIIAQNPDAFDALVSLGTDALPYLTDIGDRMPAMHSGTYEALYIRAALARMASYRIDQSLYDMTVLSPDGSICAVAKVGTFLGVDWGGTILTQYDRMVFTDTATGDVLWEYPCEELYMIRLRNQQWSPDGRYFALTFGSEHGADSMVFDVREKTARAFPDIREIAALAGVGEELPTHYHILVKAWREDGRLDGEVFFDYGMTTIGEGSFVFDPLTGEISDFICDVYRREDRGE